MKKIVLFVFFSLFLGASYAQQGTGTEVKFSGPDASPADILYYPLNAAKVKDNSAPVMKVIYSRPFKKGREIFGVLEKYDLVWRLGANENTEITFYKDVVIDHKKVKAGSYSLFAIPSKDKWTFIVNRKLDRWGAFTYDVNEDVVRVTVPVTTPAKSIEAFSMTFTETAEGANLVAAWDMTQAALPISFDKNKK